ncbi:MAG: hypothetical protein AB7R55_12415 [Gemmatimonadales bacterium]
MSPASVAGAAALAAILLACAPPDTSVLPPEREAELVSDTVLFRAANLSFRYTHDAGERDAGWDDRVASIVVTRHMVLIHKNEKVGIEIKPTSRRFYQVSRDGGRVRINAGSGGARETWSFEPPSDADGWTKAIRAVIRGSRSVANPD